MHFETPCAHRISFEIPDEWWQFTDMDRFERAPGGYYPYNSKCGQVEVIPITSIRPPVRNQGTRLLKKYKLVPVLLAFWSPECALPPVEVNPIREPGPYKFSVHNGFHRYYASIAVGYTNLPVIVQEPFSFE